MSEAIIVAVISLFGTLGGSLIGVLASNRLTVYRIEQLEKKVEKHNNLVERTYRLEEEQEVEKENSRLSTIALTTSKHITNKERMLIL